MLYFYIIEKLKEQCYNMSIFDDIKESVENFIKSKTTKYKKSTNE